MHNSGRRPGEMPYDRMAIEAATQLGYPSSVIKQIKAAKSDDEISRIMTTARNAGVYSFEIDPTADQVPRKLWSPAMKFLIEFLESDLDRAVFDWEKAGYKNCKSGGQAVYRAVDQINAPVRVCRGGKQTVVTKIEKE